MMLCVVVVLLVLAAQHGYCEPRIRLVNGATRHQGRVEVFVNGEWGTVCDDSFGWQDANVICRMLGYSKFVRTRTGGYFGHGTGEIWIDQLNCAGDEESIFDCDMNELGQHNCKHKEDAGVECYREVPRPPALMPVRLVCPHNQTCTCNNKATKRGPSASECEPSVHIEGIVEVYYEDAWQLISTDGWDDDDISVVCGQLGYPLGFGPMPDIKNNETEQEREFNSSHEGSGMYSDRERAKRESNSTVLMKEVECTGGERELRLCPHYGWGPFENPSGKVATARCGFKPHWSCGNRTEQLQPAYRLRSGVMPWQGRVEVLYSNVWGTVCDLGFNYHSCSVLCRSLGYGTCRSYATRGGYGRGIGKVWMSELRCNGTEQWLHDCKRLAWGRAPRCGEHAGDVGVECRVPDIYENQPEIVKFLPVADIRIPALINNFVEVTITEVNNSAGVNGTRFDITVVNGLLCYDDVDTKMLQVLCRSLSPSQYLLAHRYSTHYFYKGQRYKGNFICDGDELNIRECHQSFYRTNSCNIGDLVVHCDRGRPDLVPNLNRLRSSLYPHTYTHLVPMYALRCAMEDGCLASDAANKTDRDFRHLLRFDSLTMNYGLRVFSPFLNPNQWIWHACHNHYHSFEVFVAYDLLSINGTTKVAEGHKASFCLEDSTCDVGGYSQYRCGLNIQGISVNCGDLYARHLDCQWIDITGVKDGFYILQLHVNPDRLVIESDYRNNIIQCDIELIRGIIKAGSCRQSDH